MRLQERLIAFLPVLGEGILAAPPVVPHVLLDGATCKGEGRVPGLLGVV